MTEEGLVVEGLTAAYGDSTVLSGVSLRVRPGEVVAVLGPNGAGKTTVLSAIAGLVPGADGSVRVDGVELGSAAAGAREAAGVFPALAGLAARRAGACSGGEQQQLAVALGIVRRPKVLCIDELSMGLAARVVVELLSGLRALADEGDTAVLVVEQFVDAVLAVADRGVVLGGGRVIRDEPSEQLLADRAALEAAYLGSAPRRR